MRTATSDQSTVATSTFTIDILTLSNEVQVEWDDQEIKLLNVLYLIAEIFVMNCWGCCWV